MLRLVSPAKVNLHLRVGPRDDQGFHPLMSWFCATSLADVLEIEPTREPGYFLQCVTTPGDPPPPPTDDSNLIVRALRAVREHMSAREIRRAAAGAAITLHKHIPMGGGLGGGSSNAATMLLGLNRMWGLDWPRERLHALAQTLGSDVSFFLHEPSCICTGRGETVKPTPPPRLHRLLLILPAFPVSTAAVYRKFDEMGLGKLADVEHQPDWGRWTKLPATELLPLLINDLEPPAFAISPELAKLRALAEDKLGRPVRMSGSGSSLFTLFDQEQASASQAGAEALVPLAPWSIRLQTCPASGELSTFEKQPGRLGEP